MNRLVILAATGFLALMLTACGEDKGTAKPAEVQTTTVVQPAEDNSAKKADENKTETTTTVEEKKADEVQQ